MPVDVLTRSYNNLRTGVNLSETVLTKAAVNVNQFGKLFTRTVDGQIYAQPLVVTGATIGGEVVAEAVVVATTRNFVYAFDAAAPARCDYLWRTQLGTPVPRTDFNPVPPFRTITGCPDFPGRPKDYRDFTEEVGVTSTPVIDDAKQFIYVVAKSKSNGQFFTRLHKLDLSTGLDVPGSPTTIAATVDGTGFSPKNSPNGKVVFDQQWQLNRPGLLLAGGRVYLAFGSQGDEGPFHGWVFAYGADDLQFKAVHCTTPNWGEGGIWQSGSGLAFDRSHVYYVAGNGPRAGTSDQVAHAQDGASVNRRPSPQELGGGPFFGNTIVKLDPDTLAVVDWFSPTDTQDLSQDDQDFCSGPVLPEGTNLVLGLDKEGFIHACDRDGMGHYDPHQNQNVQSQKITQWNIHGTPVYWQPKGLMYLWSEQDACLGYRLTPAGVTFPPMFSRFRFPAGVNQMPGAMLALSANGNQDGIVWASHPTDKNANNATVAGTLRALDADDLLTELWNSDHDPQGSDAVGKFAKFCPPVVANGKVYLATFSRELVVYGRLAGGPGPLGSWLQASIGTGVLGSASESCDRFHVLGAGRDIWDAADAFHFVYQKAGPAVTLTAFVTGVQDTDPWAKAGLMVRGSLDPSAPHASAFVTPGNGIAFQHRDAAAGASKSFNIPGITAPHWLRITRSPAPGQPGLSRFTAFHSIDGVTWLQIDQPVEFGMAADAVAGLAVTSHTVTTANPNSLIGLEELNESTFEKVEFENP